MSYHDSRMFPHGQFVEDTKEVDAAGAVLPAVGWRVTDLQGLGSQLRLLADHAWREICEEQYCRESNHVLIYNFSYLT